MEKPVRRGASRTKRMRDVSDKINMLGTIMESGVGKMVKKVEEVVVEQNI